MSPSRPSFLLALLCALVLPGSAFAQGAASAAPPAASPDCTREKIAALNDDEELRALAVRCDTVLYLEAIARINALPLPPAPRLALRRDAPGTRAPVQIATEIYFYSFESRPGRLAVDKLNALIDALGRASGIERVVLTGGVDPIEQKVEGAALARARAQAVAAYLRAAGLDPSTRIIIADSAPAQPDTAEGRARDRVVGISMQGEAVRP